jgi:hyperosmotically inducible protein
MRTTIAMICVLFGTWLASVAVVLAQDPDANRLRPVAFVTDSAITTLIKSRLNAEHRAGLERVCVNTDKDGVVWLSGNAGSQRAIDKAMSIARETEHVRAVHSDITIWEQLRLRSSLLRSAY